MKAYKATSNLRCKSITYELGKAYTFKGKLEMCSQGFHFCQTPKDTLTYYTFNKDFVLMEIEVLGEVITKNNKSVTDKFKVSKVLSTEETNKLLDIIAEYDKKGNLIHNKDSSGNEYWYEYDKKGNLIHYKDSNGDEYWNEYDEKSNLIHHKDSNGDEWAIEIG